MSQIIDNNKPVSFFDLYKSQFPEMDMSKQYNEYFSTHRNFCIEGKGDITEEIRQFLQESTHNPENYLSEVDFITWISPAEIKKSKESFKKDKDKSSVYLDNTIFHKKALKVDDFSIFNNLDAVLPNFQEVTQFYRGAFALNQSRKNYQAPKVILLTGEPGIGKTHYAKMLSKMLNTSYYFVDTNSITANWVLSGNNGTWRSAQPGLIYRNLSTSQSISPIIVFDEFDKLSSNGGYSPYSVFHQLFEKENAMEFYDEYMDMHFDASQIVYILTANNANAISDTLLSRMSVIHVQKPDKEQMKTIIPNIYHGILDGSTLFHEQLPDETMDYLSTLTPREVTHIISGQIYKQASNKIISGNTNPEYLQIEATKNTRSAMGFN
jgi:ATP-dependent Lon protease